MLAVLLHTENMIQLLKSAPIHITILKLKNTKLTTVNLFMKSSIVNQKCFLKERFHKVYTPECSLGLNVLPQLHWAVVGFQFPEVLVRKKRICTGLNVHCTSMSMIVLFFR